MSEEQISEAIAHLRERRDLLQDAIQVLSRIARRSGHENADGESRLCNRCGEAKPRSAFHRNGNYLMSFCRECNTERCRRYYQRNRARVNGRRRERRSALKQ